MAARIVQQSHPAALRAAIYARVSTNAGQDPTMQTRELEEYCRHRGWLVSGALCQPPHAAKHLRTPRRLILRTSPRTYHAQPSAKDNYTCVIA
jgi:hypothetical protein